MLSWLTPGSGGVDTFGQDVMSRPSHLVPQPIAKSLFHETMLATKNPFPKYLLVFGTRLLLLGDLMGKLSMTQLVSN